MTQQDMDATSPAEALKARLYMLKAPQRLPKLLPEQNPQYPKKPTTVQRTNYASQQTRHFSYVKTAANQSDGHAQAIQHDYRLIITTLVTPQEAISRLREAPYGTFFYMQRADRLQKGDMFSYYICPHSMIDISDYYTISAYGVAHISAANQSFTPLDEWLDELSKLDKLRQIPIFKNFRLWKPLYQLKRAVPKNRRVRSISLLSSNLFTANYFLRASLFVVLECTDGIRGLQMIQTEYYKGRRSTNAVIKMFENFNYGKAAVFNEEEGYTQQEQPIIMHYPFTIEQFDTLTVKRCTELSELFDQVLCAISEYTRQSIDSYIVQLFAYDAEETSEPHEYQIYSTSITYTERAARMNACRRMLNYLRLTDFMLMDSLYDFAYSTLNAFKAKMECAGKEQVQYDVVASQQELLRREKEGIYRFGDEELPEELEEPEETIYKVIGSAENVFFAGKLICGIEDFYYTEQQPKAPMHRQDSLKSMLSNLSNYSWCAPSQEKQLPGPRELRNENDPPTPGKVVVPGKIAKIMLFPSYVDFYRSFDGFTESTLSVETSVRRLMNHEEFADISLPVITGDIQANNQENSKLNFLYDISAPDLKVLFTANVGFSTLTQEITALMKQQYENAVNWSVCLQPFFDAFNDCVNLDIGTIENKLFGHIISSWTGPGISNRSNKEYLQYVEQFRKLYYITIYQDENNFEAIEDYVFEVEFKEVLAQVQQFSYLRIKSKNDVPLTVYQGLNKFAMQELLVSDQEFSDLLSKMEHYRRLHFSMPERINLQLYSFDLTEIRKAFIPVSYRVLDYLKISIPLAAYKRLFLLYANIFLIYKYLNNVPSQIEDFIVYKDVVGLVSEEVIDNIKAISDNMLQLLSMYEQHAFKVPKELYLMQQAFLYNFELFKSQVNFIDAGLDNYITKQLVQLDDYCKIQFYSLYELATYMRLKSLNRSIQLFTLYDTAQFCNAYGKDLQQRKEQQQEIQNYLTIALNKQEKIGTFPELEAEIATLRAYILPDFMMATLPDLTYDTLMQQHQFMLSLKELEEEESEEDGIGDEVVEQSEEQQETEEEEQLEEKTGEEAREGEINLDETYNTTQGLNEQELQKLVDSETPPFHKLCRIFIHLMHRTQKTNQQRKELDKVEEAIRRIQRYYTSLNADMTEFPLLDKVASHIRQYDNLWSTSLAFYKEQLMISKQTFFGQLDHEYLNQLVGSVGKIAFYCERTILASDMPAILKARITELRQIVPIVISLDNQALKDRHWQEVGQALSVTIPTKVVNKGQKDEVEVPVISVNWLVFNRALVYKDYLSQVSSNAANEQNLEYAFTKLNTEWMAIDIYIKAHATIGDIFILYETADLIAKLDDSLLVVYGIASSKYAKPIQEEVNMLLRQLTHLSNCMDVFLKVQKGYLYLLNIFSSGDIQRYLPNETKMFYDLDQFWRKLMQKIYEYPSALKVTTYQISQREENNNPKVSILESQLRRYEQVLELIQKSLDDFLQSKRMAFPRLFFISDDELLDLLALAKNPLQLNYHMRKLFENVVSVDMYMNQQAGGLEISALNSEEGEKMTLVQTVKPRGSMTVWMITLEQKMRQTVAKSIRTAIETYKDYKDRGQWILANHAYSVIAGSSVFWCAGVTEALGGACNLREVGLMKSDDYDKKQNLLQYYLFKYENDLYGLVVLIKGGLTKLQRCIITALATIETHNRDTIQVLINEHITSTDEFEFQKLLRYYFYANEIDNPLQLRYNTTTLPYMNEYLGASSRLVITPLTDLVYLHIACSIYNCKAVNLAGPAGTGKSETTKDQNKARGNACVVFNCSDNVEVYVMNRFFMGFCMTGAGSCLDEFNRLELSLLSVIAGSIKQILDGLKLARAGQMNGSFIFYGYEIYLNPDTLIAISLNPGYAGRAELPYNLKNLFRTFSMVVPDYSLISEIILFSQGFSYAKPLSRKVVQLYKLSSEQLSQSNSYDFGMRGVKSVLSMAGNLRRKFQNQSEELVLIRAMQDSNLPRMIAEDRELFMGIIKDLFPTEKYEKQLNKDLQACIEKSFKQHGYQFNEVMIEKINQLFETCYIRHGVLIMGSAKSGKSVSLHTMAEALGFLRELVNSTYTNEQKKQFDSNFPLSVVNKTRIHTLNSKAITINEIYGSYDDVSGEWRDGLLGCIMRQCLSETKDPETAEKQIIVFDSHVSTEWIETMNSLLDDSKLLCLANSERLKINDYIGILFECESLKHASPATVSRLGIIFYPECPLNETYKMYAVQLKPANYASLSDDEIAEYEAKVLRAALNSTLRYQIVRWDHIVDSWLDSDFDRILAFYSLKGVPENELGCENIENMMYNRLKSLVVKLMRTMVPIGLKYASTAQNTLLPTNEIQLVYQLLHIFEAVMVYNRSQCIAYQQNNQSEMNKYAEDNGLLEVPKAPDIALMDPLDLSLFIRFTALQYIYRNQNILQSPPTPEELYRSIAQFIAEQEFYRQFETLVKNLFMFSFIWSFGGTLAAGSKQGREEFDNLIRTYIEIINEQYLQTKLKEAQGDLQNDSFEAYAPFDNGRYYPISSLQLALIPNQGTVFDYYLDWQPFIELQGEIIEAFSCIPVNDNIGKFNSTLIHKGNDDFIIGNVRDVIMNLYFVSALFSSGVEEYISLLQNEAISLPIQYMTFTELIPAFAYNPNIPFSSLFIDTYDTVRYYHLIESLIKNHNNVLITGMSGSGKTSVASALLASLDKRYQAQMIQINFSARTSSARVYSIIEDSMDKRRKNLLGPQMGKRGILFIDDLNLPAKDIYECSQPIEFLRFLIDFGGFYDKKELFLKNIADTNILACCAPPGGGRETLTMRLTTSFVLISQPESEDESLVKIYDQILASHLNYHKYNEEVTASSTGLIKALITIYHNLSAILKPTPSKMHYSFTLRDVSKVVQGLLRAPKSVIKTNDDFISLFRHEIMRVFGDRVVCDFDREHICKQIVDVLNTQAGAGLKKALTYECAYDDEGALLCMPDAIPPNPEFFEMWGDYMRMGTPLEERIYERAKDFKSNSQLMYDYLGTYNESLGTQKMNLILFEDAVFYVNKITKVLSSERGNLMNVGVGGSGRKSLTRLAAYMCEYDVATIYLKKGYSQQDFHDDVKELYFKCGLQGKNIVFLLDESQLVSDAILEDVNNILNSGLISNLFEPDEMDNIMQTTRQYINDNNLSDIIDVSNKASVFNFFINRVRDKLHIVLCLSPSGDEFRARLRTFPSLLTCMSIVWFHKWPQSALLDVSLNVLRESLQQVDFSSIIGTEDATENANYAKKLATKLAPLATEIHSNTEKLLDQYFKETNRRHYLPPATFLDLLKIYAQLLYQRIKEIAVKFNQFETGVIKLDDAKYQVTILQKQQEELKPELEKSTFKTNELIQQVDKEKVQVDEMRYNAMQDAAVVAAQTKECEMMATDAQKELDACEPIIQAAIRALDSINAGDIAEMKRVSTPTKLVKMVIESIAVLLGCKTDWASCQQMLGQTGFIKVLQYYDKDNISDQMLKKLRVYTYNEDYEPSRIEKVSVACKSLSQWVIAVEKYSYVNREVEPKRQRLAAAKGELEKKQAVLKYKQDRLAQVEQQFYVLTETLNTNQQELARLEKQMNLTKQRLDRAEKLTSALADERVRWLEYSAQLKVLLYKVVGDVFLAACGISYFGVFTRQFRARLMKYWYGLLQIYQIQTSSIEIVQGGIFGLISSDEMMLEVWKEFGLPNDQQSIDNAVIIHQVQSQKWPLLIDPYNQASNFIKEMESTSQIYIIRPTQTGIVRRFEAAIRSGIPILYDGVGEKIDPSLLPIVERQYITDGAKNMVKLGDQPIEVHPNFRLYITTKLQNPRYSPETHAKLYIINFSIAVDALEQQLLADIIKLEYPDLEKARAELTAESSADKKLLLKLAGDILYRLSSFQGSVLDNEGLIKVLNESKATSQAIVEKDKASASTRAEIELYYNYYKPVAVRTALIYFLISDMSLVEQMYLFSLAYYKQIVLGEVEKVEDFKADRNSIEKRVEKLIGILTFNLFTSISRGLFEKDKFVFAFLLGCRIQQVAGRIMDEEWQLFIKGPVFADIYNADLESRQLSAESKQLLEVLNANATLPRKLVEYVRVMCQTPYLADLAKLFLQRYSEVKSQLEACERPDEAVQYIIRLGDTKEQQFSALLELFSKYDTIPFYRLLFVKALAEEYFFVALPTFIEVLLDKRFANIKPQPLKLLYNDSTQYSPILFIISEGVDPVAYTQVLAEEQKKYFHIISLGKGQTPGVRQLLKQATSDGSWVFLQNVHLASMDFLPELEVIVESLALSKQNYISSQLDYLTLPPNTSFRLFLSSTPVEYFPQSVLQASLKCTTEPPIGMKNNMIRQIANIDYDRFEFRNSEALIEPTFNKEGVIATWKRIVFSIMYFHSNLLERRKFGPQGYNLSYDFNDTDIEICLLQLEDFFKNNFATPPTESNIQYLNLDWSAIEFIFGAIHYGGKVNDSWDKRTVLTILRQIITQQAVVKSATQVLAPYEFVSGDDRYAVSFIGNATSLTDVSTHLQDLPPIDSTTVFGMSENSAVVNYQSETMRVIYRVLNVSSECLKPGTAYKEREIVQEDRKQPESQEDAKMSREEKQKHIKEQIKQLNIYVFGVEIKQTTIDEIVDGIAANLLAKLPKMLDINEASPKSLTYDENNVPHCLTTILKQEMERFNSLLGLLRSTLQSIRLAIKGDVILSSDLESIYKSLYIGKVPAIWSKIAYPSLKPLASWFDDLILRVAALRAWLYNGRPASFWISGQYFPQGFCTALLYTHARKYKISVDSLRFDFTFAQREWGNYEGTEVSEYDDVKDSTWVHGLYLDCGYFDLEQAKLQEPKLSVLYPKLPFVRFTPVEYRNAAQQGYECPVYKTSQRAGVLSSTGHSTNFILALIVPSDLPEDRFVRLGTAALCYLDE